MCGIVGYIGNREAYPILIQGLHRLEYRGYDSAGIALIDNRGDLNVYKTKGKVNVLEDFTSDKNIVGTIGIAHTRWATHGEPNDLNAHPHYSPSGKLALIHNGIIENYSILKEMLIEKGFLFRSDTDTEVLVHLIEYVMESEEVDLCGAVQIALQQVIGAYALAVIERDNPDLIIAVRKSSPLVVGIGNGEFFLASDATPIVEYTQDVVYVNDDEVVIIERGKELRIVDYQNMPKSAAIQRLELTIGQLERGNFPHFMLKEIFEQPKRLRDCMKGRISLDFENVTLAGVIDNIDRFKSAKRILIVACGTSWHAALIGEYLIESMCRIPVEVEYASEFRYRNPVVNTDDIVIAISQSGETADTLAAIELSRSRGAFVYGICNAVGSSIPRNTNSGSYIHVGPEIGVASTKAFTGQVTVLIMLAINIARVKKTLDQQLLHSIATELFAIPDKMEQILTQNDTIQKFSNIFTYAKNFIYMGRGLNYPVAMEGALKLKEISYIHAEGYPAAEMKHGPIALIDFEMPVVVIATHNSLYEKVVSNIQEIKARRGRIIAIVNEGDDVVKGIADFCIEVPCVHEYVDPLLTVLPLQLLAYHIAVAKGKDVDQPRNLAKSVTVE